MRNCISSSAAATRRSMVGSGSSAARALGWLEKVWKGLTKVPAEGRALEGGNAVGVKPGVEAVDVGAAAVDRAVAVEAGGAGPDVPLFTVDAGDSIPAAGEGVGAPAATAEGRANHVDRAVGHRWYTEQTHRPWQPPRPGRLKDPGVGPASSARFAKKLVRIVGRRAAILREGPTVSVPGTFSDRLAENPEAKRWRRRTS